ncbi:BZ3500_MvSof-1268-A1-R1_Chr11-1g03185 [Microbotryum saponariae]|uniref:BZ3500_MvSof-1268-A1-R1_Chr11-1g03185 protein n=1 Tax=Microbotryum saponariae TaxID=289078 RepID=A0A2X0M3S2_9BASI|nr:BZ3501_MvSof-1269-A2-R1_Chr11g02760 [Microbotryum saponariae]SDA03745.1 BZ3500_MvSof-1268-A1-R1_Chr11-1g03185 [Microbotryum saponariae]
MWSHAGASHTFLLKLDKTTVRTTPEASPRFYFADTIAPTGRTSSWRVRWKGDEALFVILEEPRASTHERDGCSACQFINVGATSYFTFELALVTLPLTSPEKSQVLCEKPLKSKERSIDSTHGRSWTVRARQIFECVDDSDTGSCFFRITVRIGDAIRLATEVAQIKEESEEKLRAFNVQYKEFHLRRHPYDLRFLFTKTGRILYESSTFLKNASGYWEDLLGSGFLEAEKRAPDPPGAPVRRLTTEGMGTRGDTVTPNLEASRGCNEPIHTIEVEEDDFGLFDAYYGMLQWLRGCDITFGPVLEDDVRAMLSDSSVAAEGMAVDSDEVSEVEDLEGETAEEEAAEEEAAEEEAAEDQDEAAEDQHEEDQGEATNRRAYTSGDCEHPCPTRPVAPEVLYRLADRLRIPKLCEFVRKTIVSQLNERNAAIVLFSSLCSEFPAVRSDVLDFCVKSWNASVATSAGMIEVRKRIGRNALDIGAVEASIILCELNDRL